MDDTTQQTTSGAAIASLVLGISSLGLCLGILTGIPAVICGHIGLNHVNNSNGRIGGGGMAIAGLVMGYISIAFTVLAILLMVSSAIPSFAKASDDARKTTCIVNLKQMYCAKQQWALQHGKNDDATPSKADLDPYITGGINSLQCPSGGTYTIGAVSEMPTCTVPGHTFNY